MTIQLFAVMKGKRMVEPAFPTRLLAEQVAAAYGYGYKVVPCELTLPDESP